MSETFDQLVDGSWIVIADSEEGHALVTVQNNSAQHVAKVYIGASAPDADANGFRVRPGVDSSFGGFTGKVYIKALNNEVVESVVVIRS